MNSVNKTTSEKQPFRIICVCLGNICRPPAAQGVLKNLISRKSLESQFTVDSTGTASHHIGRTPDARMVAAAARRGYPLTSVAKSFAKKHGLERQIVLAMDRENYAEIVRIAEGNTSTLGMWSDYLDESWPRDVPDPYCGGQSGFEYLLDILKAAAPRILAK